MDIKNLVPAVHGEVREETGCLILPEMIGIQYGPFEPWCVKAFLHRTSRKGWGADILSLVRKEELSSEGYEITVSFDQIRIAAASERGVVWALTTLALLLEGNRLPCCFISDSPVYEHRGLSLDCARHFFPVSEVKKMIEEISLAKMNVLHWHLTDDQGWRIESRKFPRLQQVSGEYFTQEEIRDVCEYARLRGVEILPEVDMPGHVSALLTAYPEYSCQGKPRTLARGGGIYPVILCAGKDSVFDFLEELLTEIMALFPGKRFHLGGDEAPKSEWKNCPHCQARMKDLGLTEWEDLQGYFMSRAAQILEKNGKIPVCWNETLRSHNHPVKMQAQYWTLQYRDTMETYADSQMEWIYSDMFELYLDYPYSMTSVQKVYETIPHLGERRVSAREGLLGMEACLWTEHISECDMLESRAFPRVYALAENAWSGPGTYDEFAHRLERTMQSPLHEGISYTPAGWWVPVGEKRQREAFDYMAALNAGMSEEVREETVESSAPNEEFGKAFMTKFFHPEDLPLLMGGKKTE